MLIKRNKDQQGKLSKPKSKGAAVPHKALPLKFGAFAWESMPAELKAISVKYDGGRPPVKENISGLVLKTLAQRSIFS